MAYRRTYLSDFALINLVYAGAIVTVYGVVAGAKDTSNLVTLYDDISGTGTLANPQTLDSEGKWAAPVYVEEAVIMQVAGLSAGDHDTGIIYPSLSDADVVAAAADAAAAAVSASEADTDATAAAASAAAAAASAAGLTDEHIALVARSFG